MPEQNERSWLFSILAYQNGLISKDTIVAALIYVFQNSGHSASDWLVQQGHLSSGDRDLVERLVELHLQRNSGDAHKTLVSLNAHQFATSLAQNTPGKDLFATLATGLPARRIGTGCTSLNALRRTGESRFEIVREHAEGGLGVVYAANDLELNRLIALKQIKSGNPIDEFSVQRFVAEAEITGGLEHPGIVPVYSFGVDEHQRPFYAMRLIQGESLKIAVERFHSKESSSNSQPLNNDLRFRQILDRFISVCNTLAYAHSRGVIHRDLKPANIMLGPFGETLVVDWGLAKALESEPATMETLPPNMEHLGKQLSGGSVTATLPGSPIGTPAYMSPEQAAGDLSKIGPASDVYGLGATLYTILTGKPPLDCRSVEEAIHKVIDGDITPVRKLNPMVPAALAAICHKALATRLEDRYANPLLLAADVERWLADEPVSAYRDSLSVQFWRTIRKHRTVATAITSIAAACLLGAVIISGVLSQKNEQLAASNSEAVARLDQAMNSYDGYVSGLYEELQRGTDFTPQQIEFLLEKPRQFYEQLTDEIAAKANPSAREQGWLAVARYNLALVSEMIGRPREAVTQYERSRDVFEAILSQSPDNLSYLGGLASCYNNLASMQESLGQPTAALSIFDALESVCQKLIAAQPELVDHKIRLFDARNNKSKTLESVGKQREAVEVLQTALATLRELNHEDAPNSEMLYRLAIGQMNMGVYRSSLGELEQAERDLGLSIDAWKKLQGFASNSPALIDGLATSQLGLARLQLLSSNYQAALQTLQESEKQYRWLAENQAAIPQFRLRLATNLGLLSNAARNSGELELAELSAQECISLSDELLKIQPNVPEIMSQLGEGLHALGLTNVAKKDEINAESSFKRAAEIRHALSNLSPTNADYHHKHGASLLNLANSLARQARYEQAIEAYKQAITASEKGVELAPQSPEFKRVLATEWYQLSRSLLSTKQYNQCIEATEKYLTWYSDDPEWTLSAAQTYEEAANNIEDQDVRQAWQQRATQLLGSAKR